VQHEPLVIEGMELPKCAKSQCPSENACYYTRVQNMDSGHQLNASGEQSQPQYAAPQNFPQRQELPSPIQNDSPMPNTWIEGSSVKNIDLTFHGRLEARKARYQTLVLESSTSDVMNMESIPESIKLTVAKMRENRHMNSSLSPKSVGPFNNNPDEKGMICQNFVTDEMEAWDAVIRGMETLGKVCQMFQQYYSVVQPFAD
jgi:hypothetical protein